MRSTHTGEQPWQLVHLCYYRSCKWVVLTVTSVFLDTGWNEGRTGDLADFVRPVGRRSANQVRQMSQTRRLGQLWCHKGEYEIFAAISVGKKTVHACGKPAFSLQYIGKWYEIEKLPTTFQKGQCGTATYTAKSPGVIGVLNRELL